MSANFQVRSCNDFDYGICHSFTQLPHTGSFIIGERLTDLDIPLDRYKAKTIKEVIDTVSAVTVLGMQTLLSLTEAKTDEDLQLIRKLLGLPSEEEKKETEE